MTTNKTILKGLVVLVFLGLLLSCGGNNGKVDTANNTETEIVILHLNDIHAQIDNFAKIAWFIKQEREKNPNVFLLNAGDNFSGNPVVDQYKPKGEPILTLLNDIKVDAAALGNHDFDYGQERLKEAMEQAVYPTLCANIKVDAEQGAVIPQLKPYTVLKTANGIKIAVLSIIQTGKDSGIPATHPKNLTGIRFSWGMEAAKAYRYLKKENNVFIALTHMGFDSDERLAAEMGELDVIVGGHSHTVVKDPKEINGVLVTQAGSYAKYIGRIRLTIKDGKVVGKSGELVDVKTLENEIPEIREKINAFNNNPELEKTIATLPMVVEGKDPLGNLITDAIRIVHGLDITFHNEGGIRAPELGKEVRMKDVYKLLPFGNDIIRYEMSTAEIREFITNDYEKYKGFDLKVSGMEYTVVVRPMAGGEVEVTAVELRGASGALLDDSKTYSVGFNSYVASSYKFSHQDPGKALLTTIAQTLIDYLGKGGDICKDIEKVRTHKREETK